MSLPSREDTLRKLSTAWQDGATAATGEAWEWVCEGLAFCSRPLREASETVTKRYDLGPRGAWILNLIANGLTYPFELSNVFNCGRSLITAELYRLTEAGLITTKPGAKDRRRTELALTKPGQAANAEVRDAMAQFVHTNLAGYSADQVALFAEMLRAVRGA